MTLLLRLWGTHKKGSSMTALQKTQQIAERVRCRYLHPTSGQKLLTLWLVELEEAEEEGGPKRRPAISTNLGSLRH